MLQFRASFFSSILHGINHYLYTKKKLKFEQQRNVVFFSARESRIKIHKKIKKKSNFFIFSFFSEPNVVPQTLPSFFSFFLLMKFIHTTTTQDFRATYSAAPRERENQNGSAVCHSSMNRISGNILADRKGESERERDENRD